MPESNLLNWSPKLGCIDYAFQPIVNIHTGAVYGYEALIRNVEKAGFESIFAFFDSAFENKVLHPLDLWLRQLAQKKFRQMQGYESMQLFYNLDNRLFEGSNQGADHTLNVEEETNLPAGNLCFEISERHELANIKEKAGIISEYRNNGHKIAVDDCGVGFSGLQLLYYLKPDFIKIDRFFIKDIERDPDKRLLVSSIVKISHIMGSIVIAEGVESMGEYYSCKNIGCDLLQGYLVQKPEVDLNNLRLNYSCINLLRKIDKRNKDAGDKSLIMSEMEYIEPVFCQSKPEEIFHTFRENQAIPLHPVLNEHQEPMGIIRAAIGGVIHPPKNPASCENTNLSKTISRSFSPFPVADIHLPIEQILEIYSMHEDGEGIIIVNNRKYAGFLSTRALLTLLNEKNLAMNRDLNPLSKLPGHNLVYAYVSNALQDFKTTYHLVYFDFDNFKMYNDRFGFRRGDRIIHLFADLLKSNFQAPEMCIGHLGGDDFFAGISGSSAVAISNRVKCIAREFEDGVKGFYRGDALDSGVILGSDSIGIKIKTPLMTMSSVVLELSTAIRQGFSPEAIDIYSTRLKKESKQSPGRFRYATLYDFDKAPSRKKETGQRVRLAS